MPGIPKTYYVLLRVLTTTFSGFDCRKFRRMSKNKTDQDKMDMADLYD
jgi:hypothetical protein